MEQLCKRLRDQLRDRGDHQRHLHQGGRAHSGRGRRAWRPSASWASRPAAARIPRSARTPRSIWRRSIEMRKRFPDARPHPHRIGRRQSRRDLLARTRRSDDLCHRRLGRRENPAQGRPRRHPLGPAGDQQDRPRPLCRRFARGDGDATPLVMRKARPFVFANMKTGEGVEAMIEIPAPQGRDQNRDGGPET